MDDHVMCQLLEQEIDALKQKYQFCKEAIDSIKELLEVQDDECVIERVEDLIRGTPDERISRALLIEKDKEINRLMELCQNRLEEK